MWWSQKREGLGVEGPALGLPLLPLPLSSPPLLWAPSPTVTVYITGLGG